MKFKFKPIFKNDIFIILLEFWPIWNMDCVTCLACVLPIKFRLFNLKPTSNVNFVKKLSNTGLVSQIIFTRFEKSKEIY